MTQPPTFTAPPARTAVEHLELLKPAEVARRLRVSRSWVYAAAGDGRLPSLRLGGPDGPLRFIRSDVEAWLADARRNWLPGKATD
jgi:excisionase family DNA binding protein